MEGGEEKGESEEGYLPEMFANGKSEGKSGTPGVPLGGSAQSHARVQMSHPPKSRLSHSGLHDISPGGSPGVTVLLTWGPSPVNVVGVGTVTERRKRRSVEWMGRSLVNGGDLPLVGVGSAQSHFRVQMSHPPKSRLLHSGLHDISPGGSGVTVSGVTVLLTWGPSPVNVPFP